MLAIKGASYPCQGVITSTSMPLSQASVLTKWRKGDLTFRHDHIIPSMELAYEVSPSLSVPSTQYPQPHPLPTSALVHPRSMWVPFHQRRCKWIARSADLAAMPLREIISLHKHLCIASTKGPFSGYEWVLDSAFEMRHICLHRGIIVGSGINCQKWLKEAVICYFFSSFC